jgi:hypothetical protein
MRADWPHAGADDRRDLLGVLFAGRVLVTIPSFMMYSKGLS